MDDGSTDGPPGKQLSTEWIELSQTEAVELLESLQVWAEEVAAGRADLGWHTHLTGAAGVELSIGIRLDDDAAST